MGLGKKVVLQKWLNGVKNLLFPPSCLVCSVSLPFTDQGICSDCLQDVSPVSQPLCIVCGRGLPDSTGGNHLCGSCLRKNPPFSSARGVAYYQEPVAPLLHRLKYQGDTSVLPALREIITLYPPVDFNKKDRIIPVPLHIHRLRQRGFNQALLLAQLFFPGEKECILADTLQRARHTVPQTGLNGIARRRNMSKAFRVSDPEQVRGITIILVDDVYTTGTTVAECSRVLLAAGAREVHVLTLARVRE